MVATSSSRSNSKFFADLQRDVEQDSDHKLNDFFKSSAASPKSSTKTPERAEFELAAEEDEYSDEYDSDQEMEDSHTYSDSNDNESNGKSETDESDASESEVEKREGLAYKMATTVATPRSSESFGVGGFCGQARLDTRKYLTPGQMILNARIERDPEFTSFKDSQLSRPLKTEVRFLVLF